MRYMFALALLLSCSIGLGAESPLLLQKTGSYGDKQLSGVTATASGVSPSNVTADTFTGALTGTVTGTASDSDKLDGQHGSYYRDADQLDGQHGSYYRNGSNINAGTVGKNYLPNGFQIAWPTPPAPDIYYYLRNINSTLNWEQVPATGFEPFIPTPAATPATDYYLGGDKGWHLKSEFATSGHNHTGTYIATGGALGDLPTTLTGKAVDYANTAHYLDSYRAWQFAQWNHDHASVYAPIAGVTGTWTWNNDGSNPSVLSYYAHASVPGALITPAGKRTHFKGGSTDREELFVWYGATNYLRLLGPNAGNVATALSQILCNAGDLAITAADKILIGGTTDASTDKVQITGSVLINAPATGTGLTVANTNTANKCTGGDFAASTGWTGFGAGGWTYDAAGHADYSGSGSPGGTLEYNCSVTAKKYYKVTITVTNYTVGTNYVHVYLGGVDGSTTIAGNGTWTSYYYTTGTGNLQIIPYGAVTFTLDDITVVEQIAAISAVSAYFTGEVSAEQVSDRTNFPTCSDDEATSALLKVSGSADGMLDHSTLAGTEMATTITREVTIEGGEAEAQAYADSIGAKLESCTPTTPTAPTAIPEEISKEDGGLTAETMGGISMGETLTGSESLETTSTETTEEVTTPTVQAVIKQPGRNLNQTINYLIKDSRAKDRRIKNLEHDVAELKQAVALLKSQLGVKP